MATLVTVDALLSPESTIQIDTHGVQILNVQSLQNVSADVMLWSTLDFSVTNTGAMLLPNDERIFSVPQTIYIKSNNKRRIGLLQIRSVTL